MIQLNSAPQFRWSVRIYYEDTDSGGVVYHANYLKFFERARTEWLRSLGINQQEMVDQQRAIFALKSSQCEFHLPARMDDELVVITVLEKLGRASAVFEQEILRGEDCLVSGRFKIGCVNPDIVRPCAMPTEIYYAMQATLEASFSIN